ncbi:SMP-30/gluconolactonase/LRE family protein [Palleronia abyssalis]|uniref:6-deoxy-6-sulfogluconolactonase n=1 Tax=Palleronia abyssalis TaxID=1501240 RepID=A0A2R8BVQ8_9RHOB|nr:SMP-30/gluconolactonase/LRE family protein [Palleronia abyssalis]SPJ24220.1 6-deoxy-6-sulfogluconolactonase [Palleronia abyssalis]
MTVTVHDTTRCLLGEGPLWHPQREQLYWCDILSRRVMTREGDRLRSFDFDRFVSCLAWVDQEHLAVATQTDIALLNVETGEQTHLHPLEADNPATRSNDGRVDPWGGFWIGTMGTGKEAQAGSIYRFHKGALTQLLDGITITNAICFSPRHDWAYFTDTPTQIVMRWKLGSDGTPLGDPEPFIDETRAGHSPDGAVCDSDGRLWVSHWGSGRVAIYSPDGQFEREVRLPATQITCPAFGGPGLATLFATSAAVGLSEDAVTSDVGHGRTFAVAGEGVGQREHQLIM